jgi:hypothetical protein
MNTLRSSPKRQPLRKAAPGVPVPNNAINTDSKKRRSFVAQLFADGYGER